MLASGDTLVNGVPFRQAHACVTPPYGGPADWYTAHSPISLGNNSYVKYGLPRVLGVLDLASAGKYRGVPLFAEAGASPPPGVLYVPVRQGCELQPYQGEVDAAS